MSTFWIFFEINICLNIGPSTEYHIVPHAEFDVETNRASNLGTRIAITIESLIEPHLEFDVETHLEMLIDVDIQSNTESNISSHIGPTRVAKLFAL